MGEEGVKKGKLLCVYYYMHMRSVRREKCDAASELAASTFCDFRRLKKAECGEIAFIRYTNVTSITQAPKKVGIWSVWLKK